MWKRLTVVIAVGLALAALVATALEKTAVRMTDVERGGWEAATTCSVVYYNYCTGWIWVYSDWSPNDVVGVCYETCFGPGWEFSGLNYTWEFVYTGAPPGYGFTGTIDVWNADASCCPGSHQAGQPFYFYSGWNAHEWSGMLINPEFVVTVTFGPGANHPSGMASDHPAPGPTGPQACGFCYPMPRTCRSYYYGTTTSPYCPGISLSDGICCVEWIWDCSLWSENALAESSWGNIKALYR